MLSVMVENHTEVLKATRRWHLGVSKYQGREIILNHHSTTSVRHWRQEKASRLFRKGRSETEGR